MAIPKIRAMFTGSIGDGKDKTAEGVQKKFNQEGAFMRYISMGDEVFRPMAAKRNIPIEELHNLLKQDPSFDKEADVTLLQLFDTDESLISTSRMGPALLREGKIHRVRNAAKVITICFDCEESVRIKRVIKREIKRKDGTPLDDDEVKSLLPLFKKRVHLREHNDETRFFRLYGIKNIFHEKYFHEVIDTTNMTLEDQIEETYRVLMLYA